MHHRTILEYKKYFYLKMAALVVIGSIVAYVWQAAPVGRYGGTPVGYALGTLAAVLVVWLMWFGVRKRTYKAAYTTLAGWLSAHIYLGATLIVVVTLHASFQVGWNVHTLAYVLLLGVIASGFFGIFAYMRFPSLMTENIGGDTLDGVMQKIADADREAKQLALALPQSLLLAVGKSVTDTKIGGGVAEQLRVRHDDCPTDAAVTQLKALNQQADFKKEQAQALHQLYSILLRKQKLVARARRDLRYRAIMSIWLYVHVPLSFAMLAALLAHIVAVFFYW